MLSLFDMSDVNSRISNPPLAPFAKEELWPHQLAVALGCASIVLQRLPKVLMFSHLDGFLFIDAWRVWTMSVRFAELLLQREHTNKSDTVSLGHGRILFERRIQLFSEGVASLSGHTIAKISATPMPMDTSANR